MCSTISKIAFAVALALKVPLELYETVDDETMIVMYVVSSRKIKQIATVDSYFVVLFTTFRITGELIAQAPLYVEQKLRTPFQVMSV